MYPTSINHTIQIANIQCHNKKEIWYLLFTGVASFSKRTLLDAVWIITVMYRLWAEKKDGK
jgi:hypothetical protein